MLKSWLLPSETIIKLPVPSILIFIVFPDKSTAFTVNISPFAISKFWKFNKVTEDRSRLPLNFKVLFPPSPSRVFIPATFETIKVSLPSPPMIFSIFFSVFELVPSFTIALVFPLFTVTVKAVVTFA